MNRPLAFSSLLLLWLAFGPFSLHLLLLKTYKAMLIRIAFMISGMGSFMAGTARLTIDTNALNASSLLSALISSGPLAMGLAATGVTLMTIATILWAIDIFRIPKMSTQLAETNNPPRREESEDTPLYSDFSETELTNEPQMDTLSVSGHTEAKGGTSDVAIEPDDEVHAATPHPTENRPIRIVIGFLEGVSEKDASAYAKGFIERHFESLEKSYWYVQKHKDGWIYEVHEGGEAKAYLPAIMQALESHKAVYIPVSNRYLKAEYRDGKLISLLLPEDTKAVTTEGISASAKMTPFKGYGKSWLYAGLSAFALGLITLVAGSFVHYFTLLPERTDKGIEPVNIQRLPIGQWNTLKVPEGKYIAALRFKDGRWNFQFEEVPEAPAITEPGKKEPAQQPRGESDGK